MTKKADTPPEPPHGEPVNTPTPKPAPSTMGPAPTAEPMPTAREPGDMRMRYAMLEEAALNLNATLVQRDAARQLRSPDTITMDGVVALQMVVALANEVRVLRDRLNALEP